MKRFLFDATYKSYLPIFVAIGSIMAIHAAFRGDSQLLGMVACGAAYVLGIVHYDIEEFIVKLYIGFTSEYIITREPKEEMRDRVLKVAGGMVEAGQAVWLDADNKVRGYKPKDFLPTVHQGTDDEQEWNKAQLDSLDACLKATRGGDNFIPASIPEGDRPGSDSKHHQVYINNGYRWDKDKFVWIPPTVLKDADPSPSGPSDCGAAATDHYRNTIEDFFGNRIPKSDPIAQEILISDSDLLNPKQYDGTSGPIVPNPSPLEKKGL